MPSRTRGRTQVALRTKPVSICGQCLLAWAWYQELIETLPRVPKSRQQRDVAGRHYLTKAEINALYFATHRMKRPRGWNGPFAVGRYWRAAVVLLSITVLIAEQLGGSLRRTSRFSGVMFPGVVNLQTFKSRNSQLGDGCFIAE